MKNNSEKSQKIGKIMEINVNSTELVEVLTRVEKFISDNVSASGHSDKFFIVTPNPELILASNKNKKLKNALNSADLSIPDGIGLSQANKFFSLRLPKNIILRFFVGLFQGLRIGAATFLDRDWLTKEIKPIKGRELFTDLIALAGKNGWKVFLLGGMDNEAKIALRKLKKRYQSLKIESSRGPTLNKEAKPLTDFDKKLESEAIAQINAFSPQLLFVAYGAPKQEIWINEHLKNLKIGGAMCVGGTLRYIAGLSKLPPKWMADIGLEWLWRVITEPKRIKRVTNAFPIFPLKVFWMRITER